MATTTTASGKKKKTPGGPKPPPSLIRSLRDITRAGKRLRRRQRTLTTAAGAGAGEKADPPPVPPLVLDLNGLSVRDDGVLAVIAAMTRERVACAYLDLSMCLVTDKGAIAVAEFLTNSDTLTELRLQFNHIGDAGGAAIATALLRNESLTSLRLESNRLGDAACHAFAKALRTNCHAFRELNLHANPLLCAGATALSLSLSSNRPHVLRVNLQRCEIGDEGACAIGEALRTNSTITSLNLQRNVIADKGASAIARALRHDNRSLRVLDLRENLIANSGMQNLEKTVGINRGIRQLLIENNHYAGDEEQLHRRLTRVMDLNEIGCVGFLNCSL
jgi:hypothetical protein